MLRHPLQGRDSRLSYEDQQKAVAERRRGALAEVAAGRPESRGPTALSASTMPGRSPKGSASNAVALASDQADSARRAPRVEQIAERSISWA